MTGSHCVLGVSDWESFKPGVTQFYNTGPNRTGAGTGLVCACCHGWNMYYDCTKHGLQYCTHIIIQYFIIVDYRLVYNIHDCSLTWIDSSSRTYRCRSDLTILRTWAAINSLRQSIIIRSNIWVTTVTGALSIIWFLSELRRSGLHCDAFPAASQQYTLKSNLG